MIYSIIIERVLKASLEGELWPTLCLTTFVAAVTTQLGLLLIFLRLGYNLWFYNLKDGLISSYFIILVSLETIV
jgi:hypothetical protein